jgi:hypothetical protein
LLDLLVARRQRCDLSARQRASGQYCVGMRRPVRLAIWVLVAAATLVSGCGSTKQTSTSSTASKNASTGATANSGTQTVPRGASSKKSQHAKKAVEPKPAEAKPKPKETPEAENRRLVRKREAYQRAAARPTLEIAEMDLPVKRRYPKELQGKFMRACKAAKGSTSSCECIVVKQESNLKVERGQSLAELLALEIAFARHAASLEDIRRRRVRSPRLIRRVIRECR